MVDHASKSGRSGTSELRGILKISLSLSLGFLGEISIGAADSIMIGRLGPNALAAMGLAFSISEIIVVIGWAILFPVMVLVSQARGAGRSRTVPGIVRQGLWISGILSIPSCAILWNLEGILLMTGQIPNLAGMAGEYMDYFLWTMFPTFTYAVFILAFTAMGRTGIIVLIMWSMAGLNAILNYLLIFGEFGFPAMGIAGAGLASVIVYGAIHVIFFMFFAFHRFFRSGTAFRRAWRPNWTIIGKILRLGWPKGVEIMADKGVYSVFALLAGWLGVQAVAAYTIAYQVFIAISQLVSVAVADAVISHIGIAYGRKDHAGMWPILRTGFLVLLLLMLPMLIVLALFSPWVVELFVGAGPKALALLPIASPLVVLVAFALFFDGLHVILGQALNGMADMKAPALITTLTYWGIGLPVGMVLGFIMDLGVLGLWWGLAIGMVVAGIACLLRFKWMVGKLLIKERL